MRVVRDGCRPAVPGSPDTGRPASPVSYPAVPFSASAISSIAASSDSLTA